MQDKNNIGILERLSEAIEMPETFLTINSTLSKDPLPLFQLALNILQALPRKVDNPIRLKHPIDLVIANNLFADLSTKPIYGLNKRYQIKINSGFYHFINDIAEISVAQETRITESGELVTKERLSPDQLRDILEESIKEYVCGENVWQPSEKIATNDKERLLRELRLDQKLRQLRNIIHYNRRLFMICFTFGHEIGHITKGHFDSRGIFSLFSQKHNKTREEFEADIIGAKLLMDMISIPPSWWENKWESTGDPIYDIVWNGNRLHLEKTEYMRGDLTSFLKEFSKAESLMFIKKPISIYEIVLASALNSIATLFGVYEATEKCANALGIEYESYYPPAEKRYKTFRKICIDEFGLPEEAFSSFRGFQSAPDERFKLFQQLIKDISW